MRRPLALVRSPPYTGSFPFEGHDLHLFPFYLLVSNLFFFDLMIVMATDGTQARKSKYFVLEHMIGTEQYGKLACNWDLFLRVRDRWNGYRIWSVARSHGAWISSRR